MKPESNKQAPPPANGQEDPRLWDLLGRSTHAPAPDDFLSKILSRVDELESAGSTRGGLGRLSLAQRWDNFVDAFWGNSGLRLTGALAMLAVVCGLAIWPMLTIGPRGGTVQSPHSNPGVEKSIALIDPAGAPDHLDAEMHTILQLDDYLAFADQQAFLDTDSAAFLQ